MCVYSCVKTSRSQSSVRPMKSAPDGAAAFRKIVLRGNGVAQPFADSD